MTSERAVSANRRNAQASTGPRTTAGKQRAAQNARSHGLSAARPDAAADEVVARLAALIADGHGSDPEIADAARTLAEAQVNLARVMSVKAQWVREEMEIEQDRGLSDDLLPACPSGALLQKLEQVERNQRRAFSRRNSMARHLNTQIARSQSTAHPDWPAPKPFGAKSTLQTRAAFDAIARLQPSEWSQRPQRSRGQRQLPSL